MARTALIQRRIDVDIKRKVSTLFAKLSFNTPTAIRVFLNCMGGGADCIRMASSRISIIKALKPFGFRAFMMPRASSKLWFDLGK